MLFHLCLQLVKHTYNEFRIHTLISSSDYVLMPEMRQRL